MTIAGFDIARQAQLARWLLLFAHNHNLSMKGGSADGRHYTLEIVRARICGFGDKDRRPITLPPCIRLCIVDSSTTQERQGRTDSAWLRISGSLFDAKTKDLVTSSVTCSYGRVEAELRRWTR